MTSYNVMLLVYKIIKAKEDIMKKTFIFIITILFLFSALCACTSNSSPSDSAIESLEYRIAELEGLIASGGEQNDISELLSQLNSLKGTETGTNDTDTDTTDTSDDNTPGFKYTLNGNKATITGYSGEQTDIVIPATIDGYRVVAIGDNAFEKLHIKKVIISDGVESIGWFAFNGCAFLSSVTVPSSVSSIGHGAFGASGTSMTIYCHSDSFAVAYAKSYGITYAII